MATLLDPANSLTIIQGASYVLELTVTDEDDAVEDITGGTIVMSIKRFIDDDTPFVQKHSNQISEVDIVAPRDGRADIFLEHADTRRLDPGTYVYDVWLVLAGKYSPVVGPANLVVEASVTVFA